MNNEKKLHDITVGEAFEDMLGRRMVKESATTAVVIQTGGVQHLAFDAPVIAVERFKSKYLK